MGQYRKALQKVPDVIEGHKGLAAVLVKMGDLKGAIKEFQETLRIDPQDSVARGYLQRLKGIEDKVDKATAGVKKELETDPGNAGLHVKLGDVYRGGGDLVRAVESYEKAVSIDPGNMGALGNLALVYGRWGDYEKALDVLRKVIVVKPGNSGAYYNIACIYARQGKAEEAVRWLKDAVERGFSDWALLKTDKDLEGIRGTVYYRELMKAHGDNSGS